MRPGSLRDSALRVHVAGDKKHQTRLPWLCLSCGSDYLRKASLPLSISSSTKLDHIKSGLNAHLRVSIIPCQHMHQGRRQAAHLTIISQISPTKFSQTIHPPRLLQPDKLIMTKVSSWSRNLIGSYRTERKKRRGLMLLAIIEYVSCAALKQDDDPAATCLWAVPSLCISCTSQIMT